jgi:hypothetical protein
VKHQQDLQVALRERYRRLLVQRYDQARHELRLVTAWMIKQPAVVAALAEAERVEPKLDMESFLRQFEGQAFAWPSETEEGRAVLAWRLMQHIATAPSVHHVYEFLMLFDTAGDLNDSWREFAEVVLSPLFDFLGERAGTQSAVLHALERYVRRVEWFDREELYARFTADTRNGEEVYNLDLQRFLYLDGGYVTHAKARSASGEADLIGGVDTEDALVCDGKIFDADGRGKSYLAKGFNQVIQYAQDYQKNTAYLVTFNISGRAIQFPTDGVEGSSFPYVEVAGIRVYLVGVRALPPAQTASKLGKAHPVVVSKDDLVNPDAT